MNFEKPDLTSGFEVEFRGRLYPNHPMHRATIDLLNVMDYKTIKLDTNTLIAEIEIPSSECRDCPHLRSFKSSGNSRLFYCTSSDKIIGPEYSENYENN